MESQTRQQTNILKLPFCIFMVKSQALPQIIQFPKAITILFIFHTTEHMSFTKMVPKPVRISTPRAFKELVKLPRIFEARLLAWSATACLSYPAPET